MIRLGQDFTYGQDLSEPMRSPNLGGNALLRVFSMRRKRLRCNIRVYFLEACRRCFLRTERMPCSMRLFAERPRSTASFLIALIKASSRVVVNFFLPICQSRIFVIPYVGKNLQFLYHRMYVYTEEKYPKSVSSFTISAR